ncbi:post-transcriptional regulator [Siminovitchia fortis]|uniref:Competence protein ComN n=1 Tax=Siminovitchia fortis TaxID=254758 RepID=A0A443J4J2_9BACI|nr:post-transcriptional regulator [Siminovitchia fortis]RWR15226.1 competence protein ComN [Siminovitchia fortis]WHY82632.1 post-transcriptional regulator [Siminovitchia fortis]
MAEQNHEYDDYFHRLKPALMSKAEEFAVLGYEDISIEDLWRFLTEKTWRKPKEGVRVHELVSDVLSLKAGDFMNFATVEAYRSQGDPFEGLGNDDLQQLLKTDED